MRGQRGRRRGDVAALLTEAARPRLRVSTPLTLISSLPGRHNKLEFQVSRGDFKGKTPELPHRVDVWMMCKLLVTPEALKRIHKLESGEELPIPGGCAAGKSRRPGPEPLCCSPAGQPVRARVKAPLNTPSRGSSLRLSLFDSVCRHTVSLERQRMLPAWTAVSEGSRHCIMKELWLQKSPKL